MSRPSPCLRTHALAALLLASPPALATTSFETEAIELSEAPVDPARIAGSAHVVTEEELERLEHDDPLRVLRQLPGLYIREEDGFGLRPNIGLRGASADRSSKVTLMEDGVLLAPAPYSAPAAYFFPMLGTMSGLEVYKGPAAIRFGPNTIGGAINLLTRPIPDTLERMLEVSGGLYGFGKAHGYVGTSGRHAGFLLEALHLQSSGFKELDNGGDTGFAKNEARLKLRLNSSPDADTYHQLDLKLGYADERSDETYLGLTDADFALTPYRRYAASQRDRMTWTRTQLQASYFLSRGSSLDLRITGYRHDFARVWSKLNRFQDGPELSDILAYPDAGQMGVYLAVLRGEQDSEGSGQTLMVGANDRTFVSQGVQTLGHWRFNGTTLANTLELGARLHYDRIARHHTEDGFVMTRGVLVPDGGETGVTTRNTGETTALAFHAHDELAIGKWLFTPGARLERIDTRFHDQLADTEVPGGDTVFLPGLGALYEVGGGLDLFAGVHRGFSPVSPGQAEEVKPELSINYEAGTRLSRDIVTAELIGFFNDYANLTGECTFSSGCGDDALNEQFNAGRVYVYGLEAGLGTAWTGPAGVALYGNLAYTLTRSRFLADFESEDPLFGDVEAGDELPYVPRHQGALELGGSWKRLSATVAAAYVGDMREQAGQGEIAALERVPGHLVLDLATHVRLRDQDELYVKIDNLLGADYLVSRRPFGARPGKPFWFQVGYKLKF